MFQYKNKNIQFRSCMNIHIAFFSKLSYCTPGQHISGVPVKSFVLQIIQYRHTYGTKYPT